MKPSFTLFGVTLYPYSLLMIAGAGVSLGVFCVLSFRRHKNCFDENIFAIEMLVIAVAAALPAAMLLDSVFKWIETGTFRFGGATFYGGLLGALSLWPLLLLLKKHTVSVYERLCDAAPAIPAGHCLGRIGCFFGGCCFGKPTNGIFGVIFPPGSLPYEYYGGAVAVHPTQLYEAAYLLLLFAVLLACGKKYGFPLYCVLYGMGRYVIECFRNDDRGAFIPFLSPAQFISLLLILLGSVLFILRWVRSKKQIP